MAELADSVAVASGQRAEADESSRLPKRAQLIEDLQAGEGLVGDRTQFTTP